MSKKNKVVVLGGGFSSERNVSFASAANVAINLRELGYEVSTVDPCTGVVDAEREVEYREGSIQNAPTLEELCRLKQDVNMPSLLQSEPFLSAEIIFPLVHGEFGEDGRLQAILESENFPYVGSDYVGQALAMNKHLAKQLFVQNNVPTAPWICVKREESHELKIDLPAIVKPVNGGSTMGMSICRQTSELKAAVERAFKYDSQVMIEKFVRGREFTVGVLDQEVLAVGEIRSNAEMFDYQAKYQAPQTEEVFPAQLDPSIIEEVKLICRKVCEALQLRHYCRIDFILDDGNGVSILEANAIPGMTKKSLYPQSAEAAGVPFAKACERLCEMALRDHKPLQCN
ncbi:MAG: D-alanine--D-alanine ligase [Blastocatellia bacterium]|nr:D-alanine--D-alanine ligase [Blastocatellia bacterium]